MKLLGSLLLLPLLCACPGPSYEPLPPPVCTAAGGSSQVQAPRLLRTLTDPAGAEGWLGAPVVADVDGDQRPEIVAPRGGRLLIWSGQDGALRASSAVLGGRIWAPPLVGDFAGDGRLQIAVAAREKVYLLDGSARPLPGFPVSWADEVRSLAAGPLGAGGRPVLVAATSKNQPGQGTLRDTLLAWRGDGAVVAGFPPQRSGASGCDARCYITGSYDQGVAVGPFGGAAAVVAAQDNAYLAWHHGDGVAFDASPLFKRAKKVPGIRFFLDYGLAQRGVSDDEERDLQAHFTNSTPVLADLDGDGATELLVLGSVQNAAQSERERGVVLFALRPDGTRLPGWEAPPHFPDYLAGLRDFEDTNVVAATNALAVADLDPRRPGRDVAFAGFDGKVRVVGADGKERFAFRYTGDKDVLTSGVVVADLSADGVPELVFASYSVRAGQGALFVLSASGELLHRIALPGRGAMATPTIADADGDGALDILVSLKDGAGGVQVYAVPGSTPRCLLWPTAHGNNLRNGYVG